MTVVYSRDVLFLWVIWQALPEQLTWKKASELTNALVQEQEMPFSTIYIPSEIYKRLRDMGLLDGGMLSDKGIKFLQELENDGYFGNKPGEVFYEPGRLADVILESYVT